MSDAGRPRKPTKLKELTGTFQPSRNLPDEMVGPAMQDFAPPEGLNQHGTKEWNRIIPMLRAAGILSGLDESALFALCNEWGKYKDAEDKLMAMGRVIKAPKTGYPMLNPYETISGQSYKRYKEMAVQFGLTPAARSRVSSSLAGPGAAKDPFEQALEQVKMRVAK